MDPAKQLLTVWEHLLVQPHHVPATGKEMGNVHDDQHKRSQLTDCPDAGNFLVYPLDKPLQPREPQHLREPQEANDLKCLHLLGSLLVGVGPSDD